MITTAIVLFDFAFKTNIIFDFLCSTSAKLLKNPQSLFEILYQLRKL